MEASHVIHQTFLFAFKENRLKCYREIHSHMLMMEKMENKWIHILSSLFGGEQARRFT